MTAATSKLGADMDELISLLREIRPSYGDVGSRDVDVRKRQEQIDRAIELLARQPAAPSVEQDERGACELCKGVGKIGIPGKRCFACDGCGKSFEARPASTSANVAQGAEAHSRDLYVSEENLRLFRSGFYSMIDVGVETPNRTLRLYAAPPAQTATTDDARDAGSQ